MKWLLKKLKEWWFIIPVIIGTLVLAPIIFKLLIYAWDTYKYLLNFLTPLKEVYMTWWEMWL